MYTILCDMVPCTRIQISACLCMFLFLSVFLYGYVSVCACLSPVPSIYVSRCVYDVSVHVSMYVLVHVCIDVSYMCVHVHSCMRISVYVSMCSRNKTIGGPRTHGRFLSFFLSRASLPCSSPHLLTPTLSHDNVLPRLTLLLLGTPPLRLLPLIFFSQVIPAKSKALICRQLAATDKCLVDGADEKLQLLHLSSVTLTALQVS
jgi:hypothetical protein